MEIGFPLRVGNTSDFPSPSARAASRISSARPHRRDPVLALRLHPRSGNRPHAAGRVDLVPRRQPDLTRPRGRQHQKLERQLDRRISQHVGRVDLRDRPAADTREGVAFHAPPPVLRVPPAAPATSLLFEHGAGRRRRRWEHAGRGACRPTGHLRTAPACGWRGPARGRRRARRAWRRRVRVRGVVRGRRAAGSSCGCRWAGRRGTTRCRQRAVLAGRNGRRRPRAPWRDAGLGAWFSAARQGFRLQHPS